MDLINEKDEITVYLRRTTGVIRIGSRLRGGTKWDCVFSRLSRQWYTSASLASADEKDLVDL